MVIGNTLVSKISRYHIMPINLGSVLEKDLGPPHPLKSVQNSKYVQNSIDKLGWVAGVIGAAGPNIRQTGKCVRYYSRLRALLYLDYVHYYTCVRHIRACATI